MGFDLQHVKSDNYRHFECAICQNLADLDCVLTIPCSHCFCQGCFRQWTESTTASSNNNNNDNDTNNDMSCPTCKTSLKVTSTNNDNNNRKGLIVSAGKRILVQPIQQNAMAWRIFKAIKVACPLANSSSSCCQWQGDYGDVKNHLLNREQHPTLASIFTPPVLSEPQKYKIAVRGSGVECVNGIYERDGRFNGTYMYKKACTWNGENCWIFRFPVPYAIGKICLVYFHP